MLVYINLKHLKIDYLLVIVENITNHNNMTYPSDKPQIIITEILAMNRHNNVAEFNRMIFKINTRILDWFGFMVLNATFNNTSAIKCRSVLLVEETGVRRENQRPVANHSQTLSHNVVHLALVGNRTHNTSGDMH
jgi:hypothetical protein